MESRGFAELGGRGGFLCACADAHIRVAMAVAWRGFTGILTVLPSVRGAARRKREPGDVRPGDVEFIDFSSWLLPAVTEWH